MDDLPNKNVLEGHTLVIPCEARGDPIPALTWRFDGSDNEYDEYQKPVSPKPVIHKPISHKPVIHTPMSQKPVNS